MEIELFDQDEEPALKLSLEIYDTEDDFIPNWWLEFNAEIPVTEKHLMGILLSIPSIERQLQKLIQLLYETE